VGQLSRVKGSHSDCIIHLSGVDLHLEKHVHKNSDVYLYSTKRKCDSHVLSFNTSLFKRSVINIGVRLYNKMPTRIKQLDSFMDFKRKLQLFLLDNPFYSLNEFLYFKKIIEPISNNTSKTRNSYFIVKVVII
jgi:hypothetical protein